MELGEKLRQARLNAGLSQRQLCGEEITRNMLSQIEHGSCNPSVSTLCYLARQLGLPVSYFLEEDASASSNGGCMEAGWAAYEAGDNPGVLSALERYRGPDPIFDREYALLKELALLRLAEKNLKAGRMAIARKNVHQAQELEGEFPFLPELKQRRLMLLFQMGEKVPERELESLDGTLLLHASAALEEGRPQRAAALLDACEEQVDSRWCLLRGKAYFASGEYAAAARLLQEVEKTHPDAAISLLEQCFSAMGDFQSAYYYACKGRK